MECGQSDVQCPLPASRGTAATQPAPRPPLATWLQLADKDGALSTRWSGQGGTRFHDYEEQSHLQWDSPFPFQQSCPTETNRVSSYHRPWGAYNSSSGSALLTWCPRGSKAFPLWVTSSPGPGQLTQTALTHSTSQLIKDISSKQFWNPIESILKSS